MKTPESPMEQAAKTRREWTSAIKEGSTYRKSLSAAETAFLLLINKEVLEKYFKNTLIYSTPDHCIAIVHTGNNRDLALEGLRLWADEKETRDARIFAAMAYDKLWEITQISVARKSLTQGKRLAEGEHGLILDALAEKEGYEALRGLRTYLAAGKGISDGDEVNLVDILNNLWGEMGEGMKTARKSKKPEHALQQGS